MLKVFANSLALSEVQRVTVCQTIITCVLVDNRGETGKPGSSKVYLVGNDC